jgi:large subunit ribosomal protein L10
MAKLKSQKEKDLSELTEKLKTAKAVVFTDYRGTTVKDMDKLRRDLRKENVFYKVYKLPLVRKALEANGISAAMDYKAPVILSISEEEETTAARLIKNLAREVKTLNILEGIVGKDMVSKAQVEALGSLPSKDQLRAQFMSVLNGPMAAFARLVNALAEKKGSSSVEASQDKQAEAAAPEPVAEAAAEAPAESSAPAAAEPAAA